MLKSCPNGKGACSVSPRTRMGPDGGMYSKVISLKRNFTPTVRNEIPYALILPGFRDADWLFTLEEMASPDLTLAAGAEDGPDLSDQIVWTLSACGPRHQIR